MDTLTLDTMTAEAFRAGGQRLYGKWWQSQLATALDVDRTTVWRYANGQRRIPIKVILAMEALEKRGRVNGPESPVP
jgi:hypothetical protein